MVQSTLGLLKTSVQMSQWRHGLQLLLLGVQAWVLLLALWVRRVYHLLTKEPRLRQLRSKHEE